jgi:hypothetical protein
MLGAVVGLIAASAAVLILLFTFRAANTLAGSESLTSVLLAAVNFGVFSSVLGAALLLAGQTHRRQALVHKSLLQVVFFGLVAGAITGGLAQALHEHVEASNGQRTILKDGSRLRVGGLIMVIHSPLHSAPHIAHESRLTND